MLLEWDCCAQIICTKHFTMEQYTRYLWALALVFSFASLSSQNGLSLLAHIDPAKTHLADPDTNPSLRSILDQYGVEDYYDAFKGASSSYLQLVRYIRPDDPSTLDNLKTALENTTIFDQIDFHEWEVALPEIVAECDDPVPVTDPESADQDYLDLMELPCAWTITQGSPDVTVGTVDISLAENHPDLIGKVLSVQCFNCNMANLDFCDHGTATAGGVAAIHDNDICVAGAGNLTKVNGYVVNGTCGTITQNLTALWQAFLDGNKVVYYSIGTLGTGQIVSNLMEEITTGGTTVILPAFKQTPTFATHETYSDIEGVIASGRLQDNFDYHEYNHFNPDMEIGVPAEHSQPGTEDIWQLDAPNDGDGLLCRMNQGGTTSISAPHLAGIVALMYAENPCITPAQVESILLSTANPANNTPNNAGSVNAYQAVLGAQGSVPTNFTVNPNQTVEWNSETKQYSNITIEPTGTLILSNNTLLSMQKKGIITIKRGGKLIVHNSTITSICDRWGGIRIYGNRNLPQPDPFSTLSANQAGVALLQGATLLNANNVLSTEPHGCCTTWPDFQDHRGGLVYAIDSKFENNGRCGEFTQYPDPAAGLSFVNTSQFIRCEFANNNIGITIWDTDGILFEECRFEANANQAITTYDAGITVRNRNQFVDNQGTSIHNRATYPFLQHPVVIGSANADVLPNYFSGERDFIWSEASKPLAGLQIYNNEFFGSSGVIGVWIDGPSFYEVRGNSFQNMSGGLLGILTGDGTTQANLVECNTFLDVLGWGIGFHHENREVQFRGNQFTNVPTDFYLTGTDGLEGAIRIFQGVSNLPAGNCFTNPVQDADILTEGQTLTFSYHVRPNAPTCEIPVTPGNYVVTSLFPLGEYDCSGWIGLVPEDTTEHWLDTIKLLMVDLEDQLQQDPGNQSLQLALLATKDEKAALLELLVTQKMEAGDFHGAESLIAAENTSGYDRMLFGMKLSREAFSEAQAVLNNLPTATQDDIWFKEVQQINLLRLQQGIEFALTPEQDALLHVVALSESPYRGYARAILSLLTGEQFEREMPVLFRSHGKVQEKPALVSGLESIKVVPNPATDQFKVVFGRGLGENAVLRLMDAQGRVRAGKRHF